MKATLVCLTTLLLAAPGWAQQPVASSEMNEIAALLDLSALDRVLDIGLERHPTAPPTEWTPLDRYVSGWPAEYRSRIPALDPWNRPYTVRGFANALVVASGGPDGVLELPFPAQGDKLPEAPDRDEDVPGDDIVLIVKGTILNRPRTSAERLKVTMADLRSLGTAVEEYSIDNDRYPEQLEGLLPIERMRSTLSPLYIRSLPRRDGWGQEILYWSNGLNYVIVSVGSDGSLDKRYVSAEGVVVDGFFIGAADDPAMDMIFADGQFRQWPEIWTPD